MLQGGEYQNFYSKKKFFIHLILTVCEKHFFEKINRFVSFSLSTFF